MASTMVWPPCAVAASTAFLTSSVARYTDHTSGISEHWLGMHPATMVSPFQKLK
jgi:hypothetical protein